MKNYTFRIRFDGIEKEITLKNQSNVFNKEIFELINTSIPDDFKNGILIIPEGIEVLDDMSFSYCCGKINEVHLPASIHTIKCYAFFSGIKAIFVNEQNPYFASDEYGVLYNKQKNLIVRFPPTRQLTNYIIPFTVEEFGEFSFGKTKIDSLIIPKSVSKIGKRTFQCSELFAVDMSKSSIISLPNESFWNCKNLISISLPQKLQSIGAKCFCQCGYLEHICLPDSVNKMGSYAFLSCKKLKDIYVPRDLKTIPRSCFQECDSLERIYISSIVIRIHKTAFRNCPSLSDIISVHNKEFATVDGVLYDKNFTKLLKVPPSHCFENAKFVVPDSVRIIDEAAFDSCANFSEVNIGNATLENSAFYNCFNLRKIIIGADCKEFSPEKVKLCFALEEITVAPDNPYFKSIDGVLFDKSGKRLILYPCAKGDKTYTVPDGVVNISNSAFYNSNNLTDIYLPDSVKEIGRSAFELCKNLESINLSNVSSIGIRAFAFCEALINVDIGENANVGDYAFAFSRLKNVEGNNFQNGVNAFMMTPYNENAVDFINSKEDELSSLFIEANISPDYILAPRSYSRNYWGK